MRAQQKNSTNGDSIVSPLTSGLAVRSGTRKTKTHQAGAVDAGLPVEYLDAEQDIRAAIGLYRGAVSRPPGSSGAAPTPLPLALYLGVESDQVRCRGVLQPGQLLFRGKGQPDRPFGRLPKALLRHLLPGGSPRTHRSHVQGGADRAPGAIPAGRQRLPWLQSPLGGPARRRRILECHGIFPHQGSKTTSPRTIKRFPLPRFSRP